MALDLNDPELEISDLVYAYKSWLMPVINDKNSLSGSSRRSESQRCLKCKFSCLMKCDLSAKTVLRRCTKRN